MTTEDNRRDLNDALDQRGYAVTTLDVQEEMCWWYKPTPAFEPEFGHELFTDGEHDYIKLTPTDGGVTDLHQVLDDGGFSVVTPRKVERKVIYEPAWMNSDQASMAMYLNRGFLLHDPDAPGAGTSLQNILRVVPGPTAEEVTARIAEGTRNQDENDSGSGTGESGETPKLSLEDFLDLTPSEVTPDPETTVVETPAAPEPKFRIPCMAKKGCRYVAAGDERSKVQGAYKTHVSKKHKAA